MAENNRDKDHWRLELIPNADGTVYHTIVNQFEREIPMRVARDLTEEQTNIAYTMAHTASAHNACVSMDDPEKEINTIKDRLNFAINALRSQRYADCEDGILESLEILERE